MYKETELQAQQEYKSWTVHGLCNHLKKNSIEKVQSNFILKKMPHFFVLLWVLKGSEPTQKQVRRARGAGEFEGKKRNTKNSSKIEKAGGSSRDPTKNIFGKSAPELGYAHI